MKHLADEALILFYYQDGDDLNTAEQHLSSCAECRSRLYAIEEVLNLVIAPSVPERGPDYGSEVWGRIRAHLPESTPKQFWFTKRPWIWAAAVAALLVVVFLVGRYSAQRESSNIATNSGSMTTSAVQQVRERVLLLAVGDHLDRSQILLMELTHASGTGEIDISSQQQRAIELADATRLYRATAQQVGDSSIETLLDELERVLVQVGHQPRTIPAGDLKKIQDSIHAQGILFKVRVVRTNVLKESAKRPRVTASQGKGKTI